MPKMEKNFAFTELGDISEGRKNLGDEMPVTVYRLFLFSLRDVLARRLGEEAVDEILRESGHQAGLWFAANLLKKSDDFADFYKNLQEELKNLKIGVLRLEKSDIENLDFILTVSEDLDCSGLPVTGETVCAYDEGFIAGVFEDFTGRRFEVRETDCWATGARVCRFRAKAKDN